MTSILNRKAVKNCILNTCKKNRLGWDCQRISKQAIDEIEAFLKNKIIESV